MAQVTDTHVSPLTALARRWKLATVLVVVGIGAGVGVSYVTPVTYTGEARVAVGSQSLDARLVAGYTDASQQLASDIARYVNDRQAQADLRSVLGDQADQVETVSASPIANSSVITIEVTASTESSATRGAQTIAEQLLAQVGNNTVSPDQVLQQYTDITNRVEAARQSAASASAALGAVQASSRSTPDQLNQALAAKEQAASNLAVLQVQQDALGARYRNSVSNTPAASGLTIVRQGELESTSLNRTIQRNGLAGAVVGGLVALFAAVGLERRRTRKLEQDGRTPAPSGPASIDLEPQSEQQSSAASTRG